MMNKQYIIDEQTLRKLLYSAHKLAILERDGVDNWQWYMESCDEYIAEYVTTCLPYNTDKTVAEMQALLDNEGYTLNDLVEDQIFAFWVGSEYDNHRWLDDEED